MSAVADLDTCIENSKYEPFKIPGDIIIAELHRKSCSVGPKKNGSRLCESS